MTPRDRRRDPPDPDGRRGPSRRRRSGANEPPSWRHPLGANPLHEHPGDDRFGGTASGEHPPADAPHPRSGRPGAYRDTNDPANRGRLGRRRDAPDRRAGRPGDRPAGGPPPGPGRYGADPYGDPRNPGDPRNAGGRYDDPRGAGDPRHAGGTQGGRPPGGAYGDRWSAHGRHDAAFGPQMSGVGGYDPNAYDRSAYGGGPYGYPPDDGGGYGGPPGRSAYGGGPPGGGGPPRGRPGRRPGRRRRRRALRRLMALVGVAALVAGAGVGIQQFVLSDDSPERASPRTDTTAPGDPTTTTEPAGPASGFETPGLLTFRGSATRSYYGEGPVPANPRVVWDYPGESGGMCAESSVGSESKVWCGSGWTGQPSVFERDGRKWVVFGAYDRHVHFVDYDTGDDIIPPFPTGDIIKGSVTIDPDGYPLVYSGSRDNKLHVISIEGPQPVELWSLDAEAVQPTLWNNDWDGSPLVIDDFLYEGGENSQFHIVKLNRSYAEDGSVRVGPQLVFNTPGWDDELLSAIGDQDVSIENSVAIHDGVVYFANSGGLVQGWDISGVADGTDPTRVFRFWTGDDTDASVVIDDEGFLYVASEYERFNARSGEVGQLMKLDPRKPDDPLVWSVHDPDATGGNVAGIWATPAIHGDIVVAPTNGGNVLGVDRATGEIRWQFELPPPTWQSPVVVDDVLIQGDCNGVLHGYDVSDTTVRPPELWKVELGGCIESTPAVWNGRLFVGTRAGRFFAIGDA